MPQALNLAPPVVDEQELIRAFKEDPDRRLRDPRELATVLARSGKPLLIMDERRIDHDGPGFVFFSVVALPGSLALPALYEITDICDRNRRLMSMSGPRLLKEDAGDAVTLRTVLMKYLKQSQVLRAGITYESLRTCIRESKWAGVTTAQSGIHIKAKEYAVVADIGAYCVRTLQLKGLVILAVDRSTQNGLDPQTTRVAAGELGAVTFDVADSDAHLMILAESPEFQTGGAWIRLADLDAAMAVEDPKFADFAARVRSIPQQGTMVYWSYRFPRPVESYFGQPGHETDEGTARRRGNTHAITSS